MNLSEKQAIEIAKKYQLKYNIPGKIEDDAIFYESFYKVEGSIWDVKSKLTPSNFEGSNEIEIIISTNKKEVMFIINSSGFNEYPHHPIQNEEWDKFTDEDIEKMNNGEWEDKWDE